MVAVIAPALRLSGVLLLFALVAGLSACSPAAAPAQVAPTVTVAPAVARTVTDWDEFSGRIEARQTVEIRPRVGGYLDSVNFEEGREVRRGDLLFVIDPRPYRATLARAEADLARARAAAKLATEDANRSQRLLDARAVSREEFDQRATAVEETRAAVAAAEAAAESARLDLQYTRVTAPIDGRVSRAEVTPGNLVSAGGPGASLLTTLVSLDPVYVYFDGDENVYLKYVQMARTGERASGRNARHPVRLALANETEFEHVGYLDFVDNRLNPQTGTIRARAVFDNSKRQFTPGLFARIRLLGSGEYAAVLVDDRAIGTDQDRRFVYVVGAGDKVEYRAVKLGRMADGLRVVREGLKPGERVIVNGLQRVRPGVVVVPQLSAMDARLDRPQRVAGLGTASVAAVAF